MPGTKVGGPKARDANLGKDPKFYQRIGQIGGRNGHRGGFAANPESARVAGAKAVARADDDRRRRDNSKDRLDAYTADRRKQASLGRHRVEARVCSGAHRTNENTPSTHARSCRSRSSKPPRGA